MYVDEMLSPGVARLLESTLSVSAIHIRELSPPVVADKDLFDIARSDDGAILTKDRDLVDLVEARGAPPSIIWLRCGNTSNAAMERLLTQSAREILAFLASGEALVEIR